MTAASLMQRKILIVVFPGAGDNDDMGTQLLQSGHGSIGGTAAAKNQNLLPRNAQAGTGHQTAETEIIGVVADETAVRTADDGVHGPQALGHSRELRKKRDDGLFIGNGDIEALKIPVF